MSLSTIKNIAIVGASGNVGAPIVAALLAKNCFNITAISRVESKATFPTGLTIAHVDYSKPDTLVTALKNQDALIITMNAWAARDTSEKLIRAAAEAKVPWVIPNEFGIYTTEEAQMDTTGPNLKNDRKLIEELGVSSWISVITGFWYEHSLSGAGFYGFDVNKREVIFFDDGEEKMNTSTFPQVGRAVAALLSLPVTSEDSNGNSLTLDKYRNRKLFISSFTVNQRDMFASLKRVTGTTDSDWSISSVPAQARYDEAKVRMLKGEYDGFAKALYTRYFLPGEFKNSHPLENEALGLPTEDLDEGTKAALKLSESGYWDTYGQQ